MQLPESLTAISHSALESLSTSQALNSWPTDLREQLGYVTGLSKFISQTLSSDEELVQALPAMLAEESRCEQYRQRLSQLLESCSDEMQGHRVLRQFRNREMTYIAWRDFTASWPLEQSLEHLSQLAEA